MQVVVPDIGDFADVEVIDIIVKPGDVVEVESPLLTIETDKAAMDVPSPAAGTVTQLMVAVGDRVSAGDVIAELAEAEPSAARPEVEVQDTPPAPAAETSHAPPAPPPTRPVATPRMPVRVDEQSFGRAHASPAVRKLARELGADLGLIGGSGRKGRVTAEDVKAFVKHAMLGGAGRGATSPLPAVPTVDFAKYGPVELTPLTRIQKISGPRLHASWVNIPHVTQNDLADITALEARRQAMKDMATERGIKLTPLAFIMRACVLALNEFPVFKSSLSPDGESLVHKHYTHIGFAADTPNGLVVPVIRDADKKTVFDLAGELADLSATARDGRLKADQIQGGVFTISSLGGIGGTYFTPIINAPEVAILGVSRSRTQPVFRDGGFIPRLLLPLSLSYDHRVIDGAQAVRFTTHLGELLADAERLLEPADG